MLSFSSPTLHKAFWLYRYDVSMAFQDFPKKKKNVEAEATILQLTSYSPLFAGLAPPIARARYLTLCPENSPAPRPKGFPGTRLEPERTHSLGFPDGWGKQEGCFFEVSVTESWWKKNTQDKGGWKRKEGLVEDEFPFRFWKWCSMFILVVVGVAKACEVVLLQSSASLWGAQLNNWFVKGDASSPNQSMLVWWIVPIYNPKKSFVSDKDFNAVEMLAPCSLEQRAHLVLPET